MSENREREAFQGYVNANDWHEEQMKDPDYRRIAEGMDPAYQLLRLRLMRGLTQRELAERVGTKQPNIARLENGRVEPSLSLLKRLAEALGARWELLLVPVDDQPDQAAAKS